MKIFFITTIMLFFLPQILLSQQPDDLGMRDYLNGHTAGKQMAYKDINGTAWFISGILFPLPTYIIAALATSPKPPPAKLLGQPSQYVSGYIAGYGEEAKEVRKKYARRGCTFGIELAVLVTALLVVLQYH